MDKVMVFGTFDILHPGHIDLFRQARKHGDYLVVVVARDETVEKLKEYTPRNAFEKRLQAVEENPFVDHVRAGYLDDYFRVVREENPDVICLGYDQKFMADTLEERLQKEGIECHVYRLKPFKEDIFKSSKL